MQYYLKYQSKLSNIYCDPSIQNQSNHLGFRLQNISILTLSHIYNGAVGIGKFIGILLGSKYCAIKYISINGSGIKSSDIETMCKFIRDSNHKNTNLFELVLKNNNIDDKCIVKLLKTIGSNLVSLCHLDLSHNLITNKTCHSFAKFFNVYTINTPKGGHYYLAINNPNDYDNKYNHVSRKSNMTNISNSSANSDGSAGSLRFHGPGQGSFAVNHDDEPYDFLFDGYNNNKPKQQQDFGNNNNRSEQTHLQLLSLFNQQLPRNINRNIIDDQKQALDLFTLQNGHNQYQHPTSSLSAQFHPLQPLQSIEVESSNECDDNNNRQNPEITQPIDPSKCTSLCQINIKKCKNISGDGIASLIAMFVNPSKSKIRFRITKGNKQKYNHGVSFYNNKEMSKGHSKILTHSNWQTIARHYSIRDESIIKWEKILQTRKYDSITVDPSSAKLTMSLPALPQLPALPSIHSTNKSSNASNGSDSDTNGPFRILCAPQNSNSVSQSNNDQNICTNPINPIVNNNSNNHLTIHAASASHSNSSNSNSNPPRFINNLLSNKFSNHSNTSNQWEFDDSEEFTSSHSADNTHNFTNYSSASSSHHIAMGQSIELNTNCPSWLCNNCQTSNLNVFYTCTHCGHSRIKYYQNKHSHSKHHHVKHAINDSNDDDEYTLHHHHLVQL